MKTFADFLSTIIALSFILPSTADVLDTCPEKVCNPYNCYGRRIIEVGSAPTESPVAQASWTTNPTTPSPTEYPTKYPTGTPSVSPTAAPTVAPSSMPSDSPTKSPTQSPESSNDSDDSDEGSGPTFEPIDMECEDKPLDICIAIDMSNSICSPSTGVTLCPMCGHCEEDDLGPAVCCNNFKMQLDFAKNFIGKMDNEEMDQHFSLVSFSTIAMQEVYLTTGSAAIQEVDSIQYAGGFTNTGDAIKYCYDTLKASPNERAIVIITDGTPTAGEGSTESTGYTNENAIHQKFAEGQAQNVKGAGILIIPVAVNSVSIDMEKLELLASDPRLVVTTENFENLELDHTMDTLMAHVKCGSEEAMQGTWTLVSFDDFEDNGQISGTWNKNFLSSGGRGNLVTRAQGGERCPGDDDKCIALMFDTDTTNTTYRELEFASSPFDVSGYDLMRVKFDFVARGVSRTDNDTFHLEYMIGDESDGNDDEDWNDISFYKTGVHFNKDVAGTIEKLVDVSDIDDDIRLRFHINGTDVHDYVYLDNIKIEKYAP